MPTSSKALRVSVSPDQLKSGFSAVRMQNAHSKERVAKAYTRMKLLIDNDKVAFPIAKSDLVDLVSLHTRLPRQYARAALRRLEVREEIRVDENSGLLHRVQS